MIISETQPPPPSFIADTYERGLDPWHPDAFKGIAGVEKQIEAAHDGSPRKTGWFAVDWCGNVVGFYPDGMEIPDKKASETDTEDAQENRA